MDGWMVGWMGVLVDGWMNECVDGWMGGWRMDEWIDGWMSDITKQHSNTGK